MQKVADINTRLADEKQQRLTRIRLIERETAEFAPMWKEKQMTMYPTAVQISQTPTLGQVITEEIQKNAMNPDVLYQRAEQKLLQLADKTNTEYILDRLEDEELYYLVNNWDGVMKDLKEKYNSKQLDKNIFISLVKKNSTILKRQLKGIDFDDITTRGKLSEKQKKQRLQELEDEANDKEAKDEAERKQFRDLRNQQIADEEAQKQAELAAKLANATNSEALKALARGKYVRNQLKKAKEQAEADAKVQAEADAIAKAQAEAQAQADAKAQALPMIEDELNKLNINDDPFKSNSKPLYGTYKDDFARDLDNLTSLFSYLTDAELDNLYAEIDSKYPNKLASAKGGNPGAKVKNFMKQTTLDKYLGLQQDTQTKSVDAFNSRLSQSNSVYDQRVTELGNMKVKELRPIALNKTGKSSFPKKADIIQAILNVEFPDKNKTGKGFKLKKRRIVGKGMAEGVNDAKKSKESVMKKIINGKYIDLNKLKNNIICIRYCKTRALVPNVKVQHVSNDIKEIINDIIDDKFEKRLYEKLNVNDKRLVKRIVESLKLDIDTSSKEDDEYQRQFEICLGEFHGGNTNPQIKAKLKQYIMESMESGMLPRREAFKLLFELANS